MMDASGPADRRRHRGGLARLLSVQCARLTKNVTAKIDLIAPMD